MKKIRISEIVLNAVISFIMTIGIAVLACVILFGIIEILK